MSRRKEETNIENQSDVLKLSEKIVEASEAKQLHVETENAHLSDQITGLSQETSQPITTVFQKLTSLLMTIYILFYLCIFPLATHNQYFDVLSFRYNLFWKPTDIFGLLFIVSGMIFLILDAIFQKSEWRRSFKKQFDIRKWWKNLYFGDKCFFFLILSLGISTLFAPYQYEAFWGNRGRSCGYCLWLSFFIAYILIRSFYHFRKFHLYLYLIAGAFPCLWGIANFFWIYPIDMLGMIPDNFVYKVTFVSSVGNINTYTSMIAVYFGTAFALFLFSEKTGEKIISLLAYVIASFAMIMGISDSAVLAIAAVFAIAPFFAWKDLKKVFEYFFALTIFFLTLIFTNYLTLREGRTIVYSFNKSALLQIADTPLATILCILFAVLSFTSILVYRKRVIVAVKSLKKIWLIILLIGILGSLAIFIDANTGHHADLYAPFRNIIIFSDDWGTGRGYIWKMAMTLYMKKLNLFQKLFGHGPDTFFILSMDNYMNLMQDKGYGLMDECHNEYITYLITIGAVGLLLYLTWTISNIATMLKKSRNIEGGAIAFGIIAYMAQAMVNLAVPITLPIFMIIMFVGINASRTDY